MKEEWQEIQGFEGLYKISNTGKIVSYRTSTPRTLSINLKRGGYPKVTLFDKNNQRFTHNIHRLLAKTFISNPGNKPVTNHIDGNKNNYDLVNLEWCTRSENSLHAIRTCLFKAPKNENHYNTLFTNKQIRAIKILLNNGMNSTEVSEIFNVNRVTISDIKNGRTWKNVE